MRTPTLIIALFPLFTACDNGVEDDVGSWNADHADSEYQLARTQSPCADASASTVETDEDGNTWCGCGPNEAGVHLMMKGESDFRTVNEFESRTATDLALDADGILHIAGTDDNGEPSVVGVDVDSELDIDIPGVVSLDAAISLTSASDIGFEPTEVAADSSGNILVSDGTEVAIYNGLTWTTPEDYQGDAALLTEIIADGDAFMASGETEDGDAAVFLTETDLTTSLEATVVGDGSLNALHKMDGDAYITVGADAQGEPAAYTCEDDCTEAAAWSSVNIDAVFTGGESEEMGEATDVAFSESGNVGVMVGVGSRPGAQGWAAITADAGATWQAVDGDFPDLTSCTIDDSGEFVIMGEGNFALTGDAS